MKPRKIHRAVLFIGMVLVLMFGRAVTWADQITLENGDRLTGIVEKLQGNKLFLKTDYAGSIEIQASKVKSVVVDNPVEIRLKSGETVKGIFTLREDGQLLVDQTDHRGKVSVAWTSVAAINPPPPIIWKGGVTVGATSQSGNTDAASASVAAEVTRRTDIDRFGLRYLFNYAEDDGEVTVRNHYGAGKYDYFFTKKFYGYFAGDLLNDEFKDINVRTTVGPGIGYQIWEDDIKHLLVEAGVSYVNEDRDEAEDDDWVAGRLAAEFRYKLLDRIIFSDWAQLYPNLEDTGEYTLRNEASLTTPLSSRWALKLTNIYERNSDPPDGVDEDDVTWILGMQYSF